MDDSLFGLLESSVKEHWELNALTDYKGITLRYKDIARLVEKIHIIFENSNVQPGDKIAICGKNCSYWGAIFLATISYGAVAVPILHEFKADNVHTIVNHSDSKLLFVGDQAWENLNEAAMPNLEGIILINNLSLLVSRSEKLTYAREHLNELYGIKFPMYFRQEHVNYRRENPEDLVIISYTSGTTSAPKGVMIPYRALLSNMRYARANMTMLPGYNVVSILPLAHMFGLSFEFLFEMLNGAHVHFLTRIPSPKIIFQAFSEVKPNLIIVVPLIIEKVIKKSIFPLLKKPLMRIALALPYVKTKVREQIKKKISDAFGGNFYEIIVGGAGLNPEVESFLRSIKFPYMIGYGATECAPIICYEDWHKFKMGSCGKPVTGMELKIMSSDPEHEPGEILCRGDNVMQGYYKNPEATRAAIDSEGWFHTGDLGVMDKQGNVSIKGRSKNMILGPSGQNIYPEEIEDRLNNMPYVVESLIVEQGGKLVALIYPDFETATNDHWSEEQLTVQMENNIKTLNSQLPVYSQISKFKIHHEEFEKTPKKSIKRFLYLNEMV